MDVTIGTTLARTASTRSSAKVAWASSTAPVHLQLRRVALKVLAPELAEDRRFRRASSTSRASRPSSSTRTSSRSTTRARRRAALPRDALRRGHRPARAAPAAPPRPATSARDAGPGGRRPRRRARAASSTATSSPANILIAAGPAAARLPVRLRPRQGTASRVDSLTGDRFVGTIATSRRSRSRGQARRPRRPVRARLRALRVPHRSHALPARRGDQRDVGAPAGRTPAHRRRARSWRGRRRRHRAGAGQGAERPLRDLHGDGRAAARALGWRSPTGRPRRAGRCRARS